MKSTNVPLCIPSRLVAISIILTLSLSALLLISCGDDDPVAPPPPPPRLTVTDIDGNVYQTVTVGTQVWMAENLRVTHYRNGDSIPQTVTASDWEHLSGEGACCSFLNDSTFANVYGLLYNYRAVTHTANIAPEGWHVPSDDEWQTLFDFLGGDSVAGGKMKETGITHWRSPNTGATNASGLTLLPGGFCEDRGFFQNLFTSANLWSSTAPYASGASACIVSNSNQEVRMSIYHKSCGLSIRCVKD